MLQIKLRNTLLYPKAQLDVYFVIILEEFYRKKILFSTNWQKMNGSKYGKQTWFRRKSRKVETELFFEKHIDQQSWDETVTFYSVPSSEVHNW